MPKESTKGKSIHFRPNLTFEEKINAGVEATGLDKSTLLNELEHELDITVSRILAARSKGAERFAQALKEQRKGKR